RTIAQPALATHTISPYNAEVSMSTTHIRVAATAAMLTTFAAGSTLALNAQTSSQQVQDIIPTPCGNGILTICGEKTISECSVTPIIRGSITVGFNTVP